MVFVFLVKVNGKNIAKASWKKALFIKNRSSRPEVFCKRGVLRNFTNFPGKHQYQSLRPVTLLKKRLWHRCFLVNFAKFLRTPFFIEPLWLLLLYYYLHIHYSDYYKIKTQFYSYLHFYPEYRRIIYCA